MAASHHERRKLRRALSVFFLVLALPTGAIIWQAFDQLKFEAFYQHRNQAEALTARIDARLKDAARQAEARGFADFAFLNVTNPVNANLVQRSPLAAYPVNDQLPGVLGYFQVADNGEFSTPLLPQDPNAANTLGIPPEELAARTDLARTLHAVLADNRLVAPRAELNAGLGRNGTLSGSGGALQDAPAPRTGFDDGTATIAEDNVAEEEAFARAVPPTYAQQRFDELLPKRRQSVASGQQRPADEAADAVDSDGARLELDELLSVDATLERKSESAKQRANRTQTSAYSFARERRVLQESLPTAALPAAPAEQPAARIATFQSELDPYDFRLLDSGDFVLFRNVWRDGQRFIQGLVIDRDAFLQGALEAEYRATTLAAMSDMIVGFYGDVLKTSGGSGSRSYVASAGELRGTHLFSGSLSAPFDGIELVFAVNRLPLGPGARVLAWTTLALAAVFALGFAGLYRLGASQLRIAQQQQDFVSAVSHELKTPLTSIRMYGEMLKEGWVDDDTKRKQYYAFIHDEAERLTRMIANVLRLANISRSEPQLDIQSRTVAEIAADIETKTAQTVANSGFELRLNVDDNTRATSLNVDADAVTQIFINLLDNAVKFSQQAAKKAIDVTCSQTNTHVTLSVRDYGPGIPKDQLKKIFTLFYRSESELTRETVGTGIGLAIVHELSKAMGGSVDVVNREPGAEFRVSLPIAR